MQAIDTISVCSRLTQGWLRRAPTLWGGSNAQRGLAASVVVGGLCCFGAATKVQAETKQDFSIECAFTELSSSQDSHEKEQGHKTTIEGGTQPFVVDSTEIKPVYEIPAEDGVRHFVFPNRTKGLETAGVFFTIFPDGRAVRNHILEATSGRPTVLTQVGTCEVLE